MPVFRYALERWHADSYEATVFHRGALTPEQQTLVRQLGPDGLAGDLPANIEVRTVDLDASPEPDWLELWNHLPSGSPLPVIALRYPRFFGHPLPVWSGPLTERAVKQVRDSPLRREIAQRLVKGASAVWVLLGIGDAARDETAAAVLKKRLQHLEAALELPTLDPADVAEGLISVPEAQLKIAFSMVALSRADAWEQVFTRMLLGIEEDLATSKEPIAFPIFGRGRALFALVGKGIQDENIDEACAFLTGPCSCQVKELNPGVDMLMAVDWDQAVTAVASADRELPELSGLAGFGTNRPATVEAAKPGASPVSNAASSVQVPAPRRVAPPASRLFTVGLAAAGGVGLIIVAVGTILLLRRPRGD